VTVAAALAQRSSATLSSVVGELIIDGENAIAAAEPSTTRLAGGGAC
jgi:hypothetical protein